MLPQAGAQADAARIIEIGPNTKFGRDAVGNLNDALGRPDLITTSFSTGLAPVTMNADWNEAGFRTQLLATVNGVADFKNNYSYDNVHRVSQITQQGVTGGRTVVNKRVNYKYNAASQVTNLQRHRDLVNAALVIETDYGFDPIGRLTSMVQKTASGSNFATYTSTLDVAGRATNTSRSTSGLTPSTENVTFTYDRTGQLTYASHTGTSPYTENYIYDPNGNRAVADGVTYTNVANNRIWKDGAGYEYVYDDEGNLVSKKVIGSQYQATHYVYDHRNRMTRAYGFNAAGTLVLDAYYSYDAFNRRVIRSIDPDGYGGVGMTTTVTHYDGDDMVLVLANDASGTLQNRYLHGPAVDEILADENGSAHVLWALRDQFHNVRDLVDHQGAHYNHFDYSTFGKATDWRTTAQGYRAHAYGFQSRERDQETQLNYHRNRYYNPAIGRWMSEDPIGFAGGDANLNRFVGNSPTNWIDPEGLVQFNDKDNETIVSLKPRDRETRDTRGEYPVWPVRSLDLSKFPRTPLALPAFKWVTATGQGRRSGSRWR